jgi:hypothetical protein
MSVGDVNAFLTEYGSGAMDILQKRTYLYENVFNSMTAGEWDSMLVTFTETNDIHEDITDLEQEIGNNTYTYNRRRVTKSPVGAAIGYNGFKVNREGKGLDQVNQCMKIMMDSRKRMFNKIVARSFFAQGASVAGNGIITPVSYPGTDPAYVVAADATLAAARNAPAATYGLHIDKIQEAYSRLSDQGWDPNVNSEELYVVCSQNDYITLQNSKDSSGNRIVQDRDFTMHQFDMVSDLDTPIKRNMFRHVGLGINFIIDNTFFDVIGANGKLVNRIGATGDKTAGIGAVNLINGRRVPLFTGSSFKWYQDQITPLKVVELESKYNSFKFKEALMVSLTRVQERGVVEIEVATGVTV